MTLDLTPEGFKAWPQNLGHSDPLTTFTSYGTLPAHRQGEMIRSPPTRSTALCDNAAVRDALATITARLSA
ncbi:hypothetical protein LGH83_16345 [Lichenihabitans sp. PAMC28606]|uniref:hypothetical protein n=1 Tax=Lichenihabitans sp. PAMC28606 TaxID=2880932 RepID=UPI001D09CA67|nr:hypothetical protein [Lichenihabitans sp. PAMC28606]UDL94088.1 hypothetical protein LGH83_16345 [Lichenihabitans sp. PAMC28606]